MFFGPKRRNFWGEANIYSSMALFCVRWGRHSGGDVILSIWESQNSFHYYEYYYYYYGPLNENMVMGKHWWNFHLRINIAMYGERLLFSSALCLSLSLSHPGILLRTLQAPHTNHLLYQNHAFPFLSFFSSAFNFSPQTHTQALSIVRPELSHSFRIPIFTHTLYYSNYTQDHPIKLHIMLQMVANFSSLFQ